MLKEITFSVRWARDINWNVYCMEWSCQNKKIKEKPETVRKGDYTDQRNEIIRGMRVDADEETRETEMTVFVFLCISLYEILVTFWKIFFSEATCHNYLTLH